MAENNVDSFIPFFGRDFLTATMGWTAEERGHYIVLLITQWEQGSIPASPERVELMSPGVSRCWQTIEPKFPMGPDGLRRNARLEEHRARAMGLRRARSEAGAKGNRTRWGDRKEIAMGSQSDSQTDRKPIANGIAKASHPSPSPSPEKKEELRSSSSNEQEVTSLQFPCDKGSWTPTAEMMAEWQATFPSLDVMAQLVRARQWCIDNVERRKTSRGMRRFIGSWLANAKATPAPRGTKVLATL
jgi:uncharacterized protein YdaU (DUF1376 family)